MRKLITTTFVTLDGVMQAPGGPGEDESGGFTHGGWSVNYWDDVMGQAMDRTMGVPFDLLLGRKTWEIFAAHWPRVTGDPTADRLNAAKKYVASRTLQRADWRNSTIVRDVPAEVAKLKMQDGPELQVHGSGALIQTLLKHDLIDELRLMIFPVVLGTGKRLFGEGTTPGNLKLVGSAVATTGVIVARYERAGAIHYGSFALDAEQTTAGGK